MGKLEKAAPRWHAEVAAELNKEADALVAMGEQVSARRTRFGFMLIWIKAMGKADGSIPHGGFRPWLEKHCPNLSLSTAGSWITQARSLMEPLKWKESDLVEFSTPPHRLLLAQPEELKGQDKTHFKALEDAQKKFIPLTRYTQVELKDDATVPKVGRAKGSDGNPREKRIKAQALLKAADLAGRKAQFRQLGDLADLYANDTGAGDPDLAEEFAVVFPQIENLFRYMQRVNGGKS